MNRGDHYSVEFKRDDEGWWPGKCVCGWNGGIYPDAEDACDALMDHAYAVGASTTGSRPQTAPTKKPRP